MTEDQGREAGLKPKLDAKAVLQAADELSELEAQIKERKKALRSATSRVLTDRRKVIEGVLRLKKIENSYYNKEKKNERRYVLDQIAKAHAAGRLTIKELDE